PLSTLLFHHPHDHPHLPPFPTRRSSDLTVSAESVDFQAVRHEADIANGQFAQINLQFVEVASQHESIVITAKTIEPGIDLRNAEDRKSTRLNSSHRTISYAVFCLKKKNK